MLGLMNFLPKRRDGEQKREKEAMDGILIGKVAC
jgi:hypothetical protein